MKRTILFLAIWFFNALALFIVGIAVHQYPEFVEFMFCIIGFPLVTLIFTLHKYFSINTSEVIGIIAGYGNGLIWASIVIMILSRKHKNVHKE